MGSNGLSFVSSLRNFRASVETLCISSEAMAIIMLSGEGERTRNSATDPDKRLRGNFGHFSREEEEEFPFVQAGSKGKGRYCQKGAAPLLFQCLSEAEKVTTATDSERKRNIHHHFAIAQKSGRSLLSYPQQNFTYLREGKDERRAVKISLRLLRYQESAFVPFPAPGRDSRDTRRDQELRRCVGGGGISGRGKVPSPLLSSLPVVDSKV